MASRHRFLGLVAGSLLLFGTTGEAQAVGAAKTLPQAGPSTDAAGAVWPWLVGDIDDDTPQIVSDIVAAGLDTIYLHLWRTTGSGVGVLHMFDESGTFDSAWGSTDTNVTLTAFIEAAHDANLQVVGVVNCFLAGAPLPGDAAHEQVLLDVIDYLVNTTDPQGNAIYALDGIALDRVRFYNGSSNPTQPVTDFVGSVRGVVGVLPLHAYLLASLFYIDGPVYDGNFNSYAQATAGLEGQYGQDWEALAGILDVLSPLAYIAEGGVYGSDFGLMQAYVDVTAGYARQAIANRGAVGTRLIPGLRAYSDCTGTASVASLSASMTGAVGGGARGFMPWRYYSSVGQPELWAAIARFTRPGPDLPLAGLQSTATGGNTVLLDAGDSISVAVDSTALEVRFDLDDDGQADTPWSTDKTWTFLAPGSGEFPISVEVRDPGNHRAARRGKAVTCLPSLLVAGPPVLSAAEGGRVELTVDLGSAAAGQHYSIAASLSGTAPGIDLGAGVTLPLVEDPFLRLVLDLSGSALFSGFRGRLDSEGRGVGTIALPAGFLPPRLAGQTIFLAAFARDPNSWTATSATSVVEVRISE